MTIPKRCSTTDLAELFGISTRRVNQLAVKGVFRQLDRGAFDLSDAVRSFIAHREAAVATQYGAGELGRSKADLYLERSRIARLKRQEMEGSLASAQETTASWSQIFVLIKTRMMTIPSKLALRLSQCKVPSECKALLDSEIREGLDDVATVEIKTIKPARRRPSTEFEEDERDR